MTAKPVNPLFLVMGDNSPARLGIGIRIMFDKRKNSMFMERRKRGEQPERVWINGDDELFFDEPLNDTMLELVIKMMISVSDLGAIEVDHPDAHIREFALSIG